MLPDWHLIRTKKWFLGNMDKLNIIWSIEKMRIIWRQIGSVSGGAYVG